MNHSGNHVLQFVSEIIQQILTNAFNTIQAKSSKRNSLENKRDSLNPAIHIELLPKHETYMQRYFILNNSSYWNRKLRKLNEEVLNSFAGLDFVKSFSKLEKEKMYLSVNDKRKSDYQFDSPDPNKKVKKNEEIDNIVPSTAESSTYNPDSTTIATPVVTKSSSDIKSETTSSIQSEDKTIPTVQPFEINLESTSQSKLCIKRSQLKELKKNLNSEFTESLDAMLSKSKKNLPKIAEEKRILKEKEAEERLRQLKEMNTKDMIFKWDDVVFHGKVGK